MSGILKYNNYSYRITNEPEPNTDGNIFVFNGIRLDIYGNKEAVRMLLVSRSLPAEQLKAFGDAVRVCTLTDKYYDERFHKEYGIDSDSNRDFDLYIIPKESPAAEVTADKNRIPLIAVIIAVVAAAVLFMLLGAYGVFRLVSGVLDRKKAPDTTSSSEVFTMADNATLGDLNGDGAVNAIDASYVLANYMRISTGENVPKREMELCDVNGDGKCNASDASLIMEYYSFVATHDYVPLEEYSHDGE